MSKYVSPFGKAAERAIERYDGLDNCRDLCARFKIEEKVVNKLIRHGLQSGYCISVFDGEETTVVKSRVYETIMDAVFSTDEDYLIFYTPDGGKRLGSCFLVYGNSGYDLISDYSSTDLDAFTEWLKPVEDYCDKLETEARRGS